MNAFGSQLILGKAGCPEANIHSLEEKNIAKTLVLTKPKQEKAILIGVAIKGKDLLWSLDDSLDELGQLAATAGARVISVHKQHLDAATPYYVGTGKLELLKSLKQDLNYNLILADDELTPTQQRNLERALDIKILDRTALILDIFARHAQSREGRLQVELAQYEYLLPRLAGQWSHLERLGGGIGTRGPGETQIETDRRLIRGRIQKLKDQLEEVRQHRSHYRSNRKAVGMPVVSLVGYTNAGKSTLLNALTGAGVLSEDKLFSTLDPITRRLRLPSGANVLLTDTVGFIQKLPTTLVAAFRATLEELHDAAVILQVMDISHRNAVEQACIVNKILQDLGVSSKPRLLAFNKVDRLSEQSPNPYTEAAILSSLKLDCIHKSIWISAVQRRGLDELTTAVEKLLVQSSVQEENKRVRLAEAQ